MEGEITENFKLVCINYNRFTQSGSDPTKTNMTPYRTLQVRGRYITNQDPHVPVYLLRRCSWEPPLYSLDSSKRCFRFIKHELRSRGVLHNRIKQLLKPWRQLRRAAHAPSNDYAVVVPSPELCAKGGHIVLGCSQILGVVVSGIFHGRFHARDGIGDENWVEMCAYGGVGWRETNAHDDRLGRAADEALGFHQIELRARAVLTVWTFSYIGLRCEGVCDDIERPVAHCSYVYNLHLL